MGSICESHAKNRTKIGQFNGFWSVFLMKFDKICTTALPHPLHLPPILYHRRSKISFSRHFITVSMVRWSPFSGEKRYQTLTGRRQLGDRTTGRWDNWATGQLGDGTTGRWDNWATRQLGDSTTGRRDNWATGQLGDGI